MKYSYNLSNKVLATIFGMLFLFITGGCSSSQNNALNAPVQTQMPQPSSMQVAETEEDEEKTVVLNVSNYGRINPFKPYIERSLMTQNFGSIPEVAIPEPPAFTADTSVQELLEIKVAGVLYSPPTSTAILNIKGTDYLVHKNDNIFNFRVKAITSDKVTLCSGNNEYTAGLGEIIEGEINVDPASKGNTYFPGIKKINTMSQGAPSLSGGMTLPAPPDLMSGIK